MLAATNARSATVSARADGDRARKISFRTADEAETPVADHVARPITLRGER
jgi:hypothetical protein